MQMQIGDKLHKPCDSAIYAEYAKWCNKNDATIEDYGDFYKIVAVATDTQRQTLLAELSEKQIWLKQHDYIGTKIATGRATVADYAEEIQTMREYAARIDQINKILKGGNT